MAKLNSKNRISVDLGEQERKALLEIAGATGQTISQIVRSAIADRVATMKVVLARNQARGTALDAAFGALDGEDLAEGLLMNPPVKTSVPPQVKPAFDPLRHPCAHLNSFIPPNYTVGEIPGTCNKQGMKPCHFHATGASNCPMFLRAAHARR